MLMEHQTTKPERIKKNYSKLYQETAWINCKASSSTGKVK